MPSCFSQEATAEKKRGFAKIMLEVEEASAEEERGILHLRHTVRHRMTCPEQEEVVPEALFQLGRQLALNLLPLFQVGRQLPQPSWSWRKCCCF
mmetsp:Transcript_26305/g.47419  ORF Transcript_26305/g.47419 Transcript_26305/m.47419 type:complete len:94 (+) Transcript_26305:1-282(+)